MGDGVSADTARPDEGGKTIVKFGFLSAVPFLAGFFVAFVGVHIIEVRWGLILLINSVWRIRLETSYPLSRTMHS